MKIKEIEQIQVCLDNIKSLTEKENYKLSSAINKQIVQIRPILDTEYKRLNDSGIDINCPKICIFTNKDAKEQGFNVQNYINKKLQELVSADFKIIDYGKLDECYEDDNTRTIYFYIKYTN